MQGDHVVTETNRLFDGTKQGMFDTVTRHLFTQGRPAVMTEDMSVGAGMSTGMTPGSCMYRGPGATKCAVGCLIPDENYKVELENISASDTRILSAVGATDYALLDLMSDLQHVHDSGTHRNKDGSFELTSLASNLHRVAGTHGLNTDAIPAV
jgi:hypothetical protein